MDRHVFFAKQSLDPTVFRTAKANHHAFPRLGARFRTGTWLPPIESKTKGMHKCFSVVVKKP